MRILKSHPLLKIVNGLLIDCERLFVSSNWDSIYRRTGSVDLKYK